MDIFNGEGYFEEWFVFKETGAIGEKWAFFGMDNSNFIMNSGSYFVIIGGMAIYAVVFYFMNKVAVKFAKYRNARKFGMFIFEESYFESFVFGTKKLFLESYFDLVICSFINLTSFLRSKNLEDFREFFMTRDDLVCSTITFLHTCFILFFPVYAYHIITLNQGKFHRMEGMLEILMEGVGPRDYHSSMYTVYFLIRRLLTGFGLVVFVEYPFF